MLSEEQKKLLTEWLGRKLVCAPCIRPFTEDCEGCMGSTLASGSTFLTWQDVGDCMRKLEQEGKWRHFFLWVSDQDRYTHDWIDLISWSIRPIDEQGQIHFCKLVCEFLETTSS
jgi:hypothetical protein